MIVSELITELQAQDPTATVKIRTANDNNAVSLEEVTTSPMAAGVVLLISEGRS